VSALGTLAAGAVSGIWKIAALALAALLLAGGGSVGAGWFLAAHDRDQARVDLKTEQGVSEQLRGALHEQNRAVEAMAGAKFAADARGVLAQQLATANGKRFDGALVRIAGARATTCAEAMPEVNRLLEAIR
jgi:hypothetical protein